YLIVIDDVRTIRAWEAIRSMFPDNNCGSGNAESSIFPEGYEIEKYRLLCIWIAELLVMEKRGFTPMEVAESYLDELSLECNFVSLIGGQYPGMSYDRIRRLSIQGDDSRRQSSVNMAGQRRHDNGIEGMNVQHVRSLSIFHQKEQQQQLDHLFNFTLMRVLDLEGCVGLTKDHLQCICRLYLLRFLSFRGTDISKVPPQIEKLEHLQTLDVRDTTSGGCHLPETVKKLYQLECLQTSHSSVMPSANRMWRLPRGLRNMTKLREVGFSIHGNDTEVAEDLVVYAEDIVFDTEVLPQFAQSLSNSHSLRRLIIGEMGFGYILSLFLDALDPSPRFLRYLMIAGGINHLPPWIGKLTYLVRGQDSTGTSCLTACASVPASRPSPFIDDATMALSWLHALSTSSQRSPTSECQCPHIIRFEKGSMENLQTLLVNMTDNVDKRIEGIEHLASIKEVQLWGDENNTAIAHAVEELKKENLRRDANKQFQIVIKYE
ncbi:hypothetical protein BDA96_02G050600, partial [Sorghum bicolor]